MKWFSPELKRCFIAVPFLLLYFWLKAEPTMHSSSATLLLSALLFFSVIPLLLHIVEGKTRYIVATLWAAIACLILFEFVQLIAFRQYSEKNFQREVERSSKIVRERSLGFLGMAQNEVTEIQNVLRTTVGMNPGRVQILLQDRFGNTPFWWGVYREGRLLSWRGQPRMSEEFPAYGAEEVSVYNALHQQFLKVKREMSVQEDLYYVTVMWPIAADYGVENEYLHSYNRLTDGLSVQPRLLYTSSESSTGSPDLKIVAVDVTDEFSISAVYDRQHYGQMLQARFEYLHWWIELIALLFLVYTSIILTFSFVGICGQEGCPGLISYWLSFLLCSILSVLTVGTFHQFGSGTIFNTRLFYVDGYGNIFHTPGHLIFSAFFALNAVFSLVLLFRRLELHLKGNNKSLRLIALFIASFLSGFLFLGYFKLQKEFIVAGANELQPLTLQESDIARISTAFGLLWTDLAFAVSIALLFSFFIRKLPLKKWKPLIVAGVQVAAFLAFFLIYRPSRTMPLGLVAILFFGISLFVYFTPRLWSWFERVNLLTRFIATIALCSVVSFVFYFARFHYAQNYQRRYIERVAALEVYEIRKHVQEAVRISLQDLDRAVQTVSLDTRIPDLAYRLWVRTELSRRGLRSAVSLYDLNGDLQSRFSLALPSLNINVSGRSRGETWNTQSSDVQFGTIKKPIIISVRMVDASHFLVVEALANHENLTFVPSVSPFHEIFRPEPKSRGFLVPELNVYDSFWHPLFQTDQKISPRIDRARETLERSKTAWICETTDGQRYNVYYFQMQGGFAALAVPVRKNLTQIVQLIDLIVLNFFWLLAFTLTFVFFFKPYLMLHFQAETPIRFSFFQKMLLAFALFSIVPMILLTALVRNYVWEKRTAEVTARALNSFLVVSETITQYLYGPGAPAATNDSPVDNSVAELLGQVVKQDVSFFLRRDLIATSREEMYSGGFVGNLIDGKADVELTLRGQKHSITESQIGAMKYLNLSGRIYRGKVKEELIISIPFQIEERSVEKEILALKEYMALAGAGLVLVSVFLGWFLASRFTSPVRVLIDGATQMARGNLQHRIPEVYRDEFLQLVRAFNAMAASLHEQKEALEQRRKYIENILNNITTAVISIDNTINITTINPAANRMFGVNPDYKGPLPALMGHKEDWQEIQKVFEEFAKAPDRYQVREISLFLTNREINYRLVYVPLFDREQWTGAVILIEDVSDIIRSNRLSAWAEMARRVAHEVKNPLTPIQLAVEHLMRVWEDKSPNFEAVLKSCSDAILRQVKALRRLVSDFSQYGKPSIIDRKEIRLDNFLKDLAMSYASHMPEGILIETDIEPNLPAVRVDTEKLRGALMNIIENGLQAMNGKGQISVNAQRDPNGFVRIKIQDSGEGVPPELLPRLFEPYFSTKTGGTGLGLPIARKNIEEQGGHIEVQSKQGEGTTVTILLPEARIPEGSAAVKR
jgi:signal transduction histidine kinase